MTDAKAVLAEIIDYFWDREEGPGNWWAHDDDCTSYGLQFNGPEGQMFWLDLDKNGTISLVWQKGADGQPESLRFIQKPPNT